MIQKRTLSCSSYISNENSIYNCLQLKLGDFVINIKSMRNKIKMCIIYTSIASSCRGNMINVGSAIAPRLFCLARQTISQNRVATSTRVHSPLEIFQHPHLCLVHDHHSTKVLFLVAEESYINFFSSQTLLTKHTTMTTSSKAYRNAWRNQASWDSLPPLPSQNGATGLI